MVNISGNQNKNILMFLHLRKAKQQNSDIFNNTRNPNKKSDIVNISGNPNKNILILLTSQETQIEIF